MGQRHQVYAVVNHHEGKAKIEAIHHQWLYGRTALLLLANTLELDRRAGEYGPFKDANNALDALKATYSVDYRSGYFHAVHDLKGLDNPLEGDNNDGITIIDFRGKRPKYCFMALPDSEITDDLKPLTPLNATEYVRHYYHPDCYAYKQRPEQIPAIEKEIARLVKRLDRYQVLTLADVKAIFPAMFEPTTIPA